jgi:SOS-response transcriptional repressor LexA
MDQVFGLEHTTNPPVIISPIAETPIVESSSQINTATPSTPSQESFDDDDDSPSPSATKQKVKKKNNDKMAILIEMMTRKLEIEDEESEERKRSQKAKEEWLERGEQREQQLVDLCGQLVKHLTGK